MKLQWIIRFNKNNNIYIADFFELIAVIKKKPKRKNMSRDVLKRDLPLKQEKKETVNKNQVVGKWYI